ncbi:DUF6881 domain-containing protein [Erwinia mallotivora]|uniref:DUF6881 domain-containing protein n=1 Tax=Erwinia mallotivora TaxID=69222 RepID=UPI0021C0A188|nr:hypothetical protein [Erwinia mallotivora]
MVKYIKAKWFHDEKDYPVEIYSEVDNERYELRKVEIFRDGNAGYADEKRNSGNTLLGESPMPRLNEINSDNEFSAQEISLDDFESIWNKFYF